MPRHRDNRYYTNGARLAMQWEDCYLPKLLRGETEESSA